MTTHLRIQIERERDYETHSFFFVKKQTTAAVIVTAVVAVQTEKDKPNGQLDDMIKEQMRTNLYM